MKTIVTRMIDRPARRQTVEVSTLIRMWVVEGMRRESMDRQVSHPSATHCQYSTTLPQLPVRMASKPF
jgi:hypothetical protein